MHRPSRRKAWHHVDGVSTNFSRLLQRNAIRLGLPHIHTHCMAVLPCSSPSVHAPTCRPAELFCPHLVMASGHMRACIRNHDCGLRPKLCLDAPALRSHLLLDRFCPILTSLRLSTTCLQRDSKFPVPQLVQVRPFYLFDQGCHVF